MRWFVIRGAGPWRVVEYPTGAEWRFDDAKAAVAFLQTAKRPPGLRVPKAFVN